MCSVAESNSGPFTSNCHSFKLKKYIKMLHHLLPSEHLIKRQFFAAITFDKMTFNVDTALDAITLSAATTFD